MNEYNKADIARHGKATVWRGYKKKKKLQAQRFISQMQAKESS